MWYTGIELQKPNATYFLSLVRGMSTACRLVSGGTYPLWLRELKHLFLQSLTFLVFLFVVFCSHMQPHLQVLHLSLQLCYYSWVCSSFLFCFGLVTRKITTGRSDTLNTVMGQLQEPYEDVQIKKKGPLLIVPLWVWEIICNVQQPFYNEWVLSNDSSSKVWWSIRICCNVEWLSTPGNCIDEERMLSCFLI